MLTDEEKEIIIDAIENSVEYERSTLLDYLNWKK